MLGCILLPSIKTWLEMLAKCKEYASKWWFKGDSPWWKLKNNLKQTKKNKDFIESMRTSQVIGTSNLPQNPAVRDAITGAAATIPTQLVLFLFTQKKKKVSSQKPHCFIPKKQKHLNSKESVEGSPKNMTGRCVFFVISQQISPKIVQNFSVFCGFCQRCFFTFQKDLNHTAYDPCIWYVCPYIYLEIQPNVGKYSIHGSYG